MSQPVSRAAVAVVDFPGLVSNGGPTAPPDQPGAAADQVNLVGTRPGELRVRPGYRLVEYDAEEF